MRMKAEFKARLENAKAELAAAEAVAPASDEFTLTEFRQTFTELRLAIDCLLHATQPQPTAD